MRVCPDLARVTVGNAEVRLFNLSPDTKEASMAVDGKTTASDVTFTLGSDWASMPSTKQSFVVTDSSSGKTLTSFSQTPPVGASSVFLIGSQDAGVTAEYKTQSVFLVDNP